MIIELFKGFEGGDFSSATAALLSRVFWTGLFAFIIVECIGIAARWRIYDKAGENGWKILIPYYGRYVFYKFAWNEKAAVAAVAVSAAMGAAARAYSGYANETGNKSLSIYLILTLVLGFAELFLRVVFCINLAKRFGQNELFSAGLILLPTVFYIILGFGQYRYDRNAPVLFDIKEDKEESAGDNV